MDQRRRVISTVMWWVNNIFEEILEVKTYQIEILELKAKKLLEELAKLKLIRVLEIPDPKGEFKQLLSKMRGKGTSKPTLKEIFKEVEIVRKRRHQGA